MDIENKNLSWSENLKSFLKPTVIRMLFLGFSGGIPLYLIFSSLSIWLREAGLERSTVTFFSWAVLGYSFKFIWAPLVDRLPLPYLTRKLGRRRSWMIFSQFAIMVGILGMAFTNPQNSSSALTMMALFAVLLGFSSATQDIVIDAYRIESDTAEMQAILSSTYIAGYRIAMIVSGAGALYFAEWFGSTKEIYVYSAWMWTYIIMALTMLVGLITALVIPEPLFENKKIDDYSSKDYLKFFSLFLFVALIFIITFFLSSDLVKQLKTQVVEIVGNGLGRFLVESLRLITALIISIFFTKLILKTNFVNKKMVTESYLDPIKDFFNRYGQSTAILLLSLVGLYRISDIVLGVIANVFYQDLGFTKGQIASVTKVFGVLMTLLGGFMGGFFTVKYGVIRILFVGALLSAGTNILFMILAQIGNNMPMLYLVISADNLAAGLSMAAFIAFLSSLTNISFTAVQYAIFSSVMTLFPKILGGYSGTIVDSIGYSNFFAMTAIMGIPVLYLVWLAGKKLDINKEKLS